MKRLAALLGSLFALLVVSALSAKPIPTDNSLEVSINAGDPSWATFIFGHPPNGTQGTTELIIQCDFDRAELITNFDVYGEQMTSRFFAVTCTRNGASFSYTLNGTPLHESLVMTGTGPNGKVVQNFNVTINDASWTKTGSGVYAKNTGSAEITY